MQHKFTITPEILQGVRRGLGMTQAEFAATLGVSWRTYCRYEGGHMTIPQPVIRLVWMIHNSGVPGEWDG